MSSSENPNNKRISIDLPEELISRFDQLRKEWGLRARGPVIEKLLTELLQEDDLIPKNQQQTINFNEKQEANEYSNFDEKAELVLIKTDIGKENIDCDDKNNPLNKKENREKTNSDINLPNFVGNKVKNLRRSINSEKIKEKIYDIQVDSIKESELIKCRIEIISHWKTYMDQFLMII